MIRMSRIFLTHTRSIHVDSIRVAGSMVFMVLMVQEHPPRGKENTPPSFRFFFSLVVERVVSIW